MEDGADHSFLFPRGMGAVGVPIALAMGWQAQGKKLWTAPLKQGGKRQSRPLPSKAISEDVDECGCGQFTQRRFWQGSRAFNVWLLAVTEIGAVGFQIEGSYLPRLATGKSPPAICAILDNADWSDGSKSA